MYDIDRFVYWFFVVFGSFFIDYFTLLLVRDVFLIFNYFKLKLLIIVLLVYELLPLPYNIADL